MRRRHGSRRPPGAEPIPGLHPLAGLWLVAPASPCSRCCRFAIGPALPPLDHVPSASGARIGRCSALPAICRRLQCAVHVVVWANLASLWLGFWDALVAGTLLRRRRVGGNAWLESTMGERRPGLRRDRALRSDRRSRQSASSCRTLRASRLPRRPTSRFPETSVVTSGRSITAGTSAPSVGQMFGPSWPWTWTLLAYDWRLRRVNFPTNGDARRERAVSFFT